MYRITILGLFSLLLMVGGPAAAQSETIRITNGEWQPFMSEQSPHYGFLSHIISEAFALVGVRVEYGFFPWKRSYELAKKGQWDGAAAYWASEERAQHFYYTDPITASKTAFFHLESTEFDWNSMEDLKDLKIGATINYNYGKEFQEAENSGLIRTERITKDELNLRKLLKGRIQIFPGGVMVTYEQIRDIFSEEEAVLFTHHRKLLGEARDLHLLLSKENPGNERMRDLFNKGLTLLKESGGLDQIVADALAGKYSKKK